MSHARLSFQPAKELRLEDSGSGIGCKPPQRKAVILGEAFQAEDEAKKLKDEYVSISLALNLLLTGFFILIVKKLMQARPVAAVYPQLLERAKSAEHRASPKKPGACTPKIHFERDCEGNAGIWFASF